MARVLWRDAQGREGSLELTAQDVHIGRAVECAIRTDDAMVSRNHARLYWAGGQYCLEDLGSANGVFYQEQRVTQHLLKHGDAVRCGSLWLRFVDDGPAAYAYGQPGYPQQPVTPQAGPQYPVQGQGAEVAPQLASQEALRATHAMPPGVQSSKPPSGSMPALPHHGQGHGGQGQGQGREAPVASQYVNEQHAEEIRLLRRRLEQLQTELRMYRGGGDSEIAAKIEQLETENSGLEAENSKLKARVKELEDTLVVQGADAKVQRAGTLAVKTGELVQQLNDTLSNLRINVMAAEDEFEQFAQLLPRASFELIREALRTSANDVSAAREHLRHLRELAR